MYTGIKDTGNLIMAKIFFYILNIAFILITLQIFAVIMITFLNINVYYQIIVMVTYKKLRNDMQLTTLALTELAAEKSKETTDKWLD